MCGRFVRKGEPKKVARDLGIADERTGPNGSLHILEMHTHPMARWQSRGGSVRNDNPGLIDQVEPQPTTQELFSMSS
jgi:hypothetical protein